MHYASTPEGVNSALAAVADLNDQTIDQISYKCSISHNLEKHLVDNGSRTGGSSPATPGSATAGSTTPAIASLSLKNPAIMTPTNSANTGFSPLAAGQSSGHPKPAYIAPNNTLYRSRAELHAATPLPPPPYAPNYHDVGDSSPASTRNSAHGHFIAGSHSQPGYSAAPRGHIPPLHKAFFQGQTVDEKRLLAMQQKQRQEEELYYAAMLEREIADRSIHHRNSFTGHSGPSMPRSHFYASSLSQRTSPNASSAANTLSFGIAGMSTQSTFDSSNGMFRPNKMESYNVPTLQMPPSLVSPLDTFGSNVPLESESLSSNNSVNHAHGTQNQPSFGGPSHQLTGSLPIDGDTICSVSSSGRYSLFSDSSVGPIAVDAQVSSVQSFLPSLGTSSEGFYEDLLKLPPDAMESDRDLFNFSRQQYERRLFGEVISWNSERDRRGPLALSSNVASHQGELDLGRNESHMFEFEHRARPTKATVGTNYGEPLRPQNSATRPASGYHSYPLF